MREQQYKEEYTRSLEVKTVECDEASDVEDVGIGKERNEGKHKIAEKAKENE